MKFSRFLDIWDHHWGSSPEGAAQLEAIADSLGWRILAHPNHLTLLPKQRNIILGAAPWSRPDLEVLDALAAGLRTVKEENERSGQSLFAPQICLFNPDKATPYEHWFAHVPMPLQLPVYVEYFGDGRLRGFLQGKAALALIPQLPYI